MKWKCRETTSQCQLCGIAAVILWYWPHINTIEWKKKKKKWSVNEEKHEVVFRLGSRAAGISIIILRHLTYTICSYSLYIICLIYSVVENWMSVLLAERECFASDKWRYIIPLFRQGYRGKPSSPSAHFVSMGASRAYLCWRKMHCKHAANKMLSTFHFMSRPGWRIF